MTTLESSANTLTRDQASPTEIGIVIRTKFFDEFLLRATREHEIRQVVILAAGMDTRAFRLKWPTHTRLFEVDQPDLLLHKKQLLASAGASLTCSRWSIGVDLVQNPSWSATLMRAGFDPHRASVWLIEGLLPYLSESAVLTLLDKVMALSAPGSQLGLTAINCDMLTSSATQLWLKFMEEAGVPWLSAMDDPETFLAKCGWAATVVQPGEDGANFGRWSYPIVPRSVPNAPRSWLVTAVRSDKLTQILVS
jgi:methyltransferase (TIGR00027 family)